MASTFFALLDDISFVTKVAIKKVFDMLWDVLVSKLLREFGYGNFFKSVQ